MNYKIIGNVCDFVKGFKKLYMVFLAMGCCMEVTIPCADLGIRPTGINSTETIIAV
jgi:hypothetical protein